MNNDDIKKILNDLYTLDPGLRSREKELTTIIRAMAIKPEAHYDPKFASTLRVQLLHELANNKPHKRTLADLFANNSLRYTVAGVALVAIVAIAATSFSLQPKTGGTLALNSAKVTIQNVGPNAFGKLSPASAVSAPAANPVSAPAAAPAAQSGAATAPVGANSAAMAPMMPTAIRVGGPMLPPGHITTVKYDYTGDPISQDQAQLNVLKKTPQPLSADQATNALEQAGFGQINLSSFSGLSMSNVTLSQNQSFGYQISLDLTNGTFSINQNYNEWPQTATSPLTASDIPSDSAVIATANQFMSDHAITMANYGQPTVTQNNNIIVPVASASNGVSGSATNMPMIPYYSDTEQVTYPLMVNGMGVYDTNGNQIGITVDVNIRYNRVANVFGLGTENYQASGYDAITNTSTILSMAETAPSYPVIYNGANGGVGASSSNSNSDSTTNTVVTYHLGTPTMAYEDMYQTDSNGQSSEFLVPAFVFPVMTTSSDNATQNVVVPLIQDFVQQNTGGVMIPYNVKANAQ